MRLILLQLGIKTLHLSFGILINFLDMFTVKLFQWFVHYQHLNALLLQTIPVSLISHNSVSQFTTT